MTAPGPRGRLLGSWLVVAAASLTLLAGGVMVYQLRGLALDDAQSPGASAAPQSIVLISIDTLRPDHLGAYGYQRPTSPNIDALAASGVLFENAFSTSSWTLPAHASMLSGVTPYRHGAIAAAARIRDDVPLLAEMLHARGYHTTAFVNAPFVGRSYGFARGFDRFEQRFASNRRDVSERQRQVLDGLATLQPPFFLFVHYMDVHAPYRVPQKFNRFAKDRRSLAVLGDAGQRGFLDVQQEIRTGRRKLSTADAQRLADLYDGEILAMDAKIGELVTVLRARFPAAIVVLTSDHGEEFLEHGSIGHGETLYDEVLRVPLIVSGPGVARGVRVSAMVSLLDLVPTVLDWLGVPLPDGLEGGTLAALLAGRAAAGPRKAALALHTASHDGSLALRGVRDEQHKLIRDDHAARDELYDLVQDPAERQSLAPAETDARLEQALAQLGVPEIVAAPRPDAETVESLKALGYL